MGDEEKVILCSSEELADWFGLSKRRILQLTQEGILQTQSESGGVYGKGARKFNLKENVLKYINYLQERARGRGSVSEEELKKKKLEADIALKESQGELHQLKTAIASGEYISVEEVGMDYSKFFATFKRFAMSIPARIVGLIAGQLDPVEVRRLEKDMLQEITRMLDAFIVAGTDKKPAKEEKPKRGRPRKAPKE